METANGAALVDVPALIDGRSISRFQLRVVALYAAIIFMDGFDAQAIGYVAPTLGKVWNLPPGALGPAFGVGLFVLMLGALIAGPTADRVGHKSVIILCTLFFGICTLLTATADSLTNLMLCLNGMRNGVSAATGLSGNDGDRDDAIRRFAIRLGGEAVRIGQVLGYELENIGNLDPDRLALASEGDRTALAEIEAAMIAGSNTGSRSDLQRPSMGQDMLKGRRTEIDYLNGFIVEKGEAIGLPTTANATLTAIVKRVERGEIAARPENISGLRPSGPA